MAFPLWPRLIVPWLFYGNHTSENFVKNSGLASNVNIFLAKVCYYCDVLENLALVGISYVVDISGNDEADYDDNGDDQYLIALAHKIFFATFLISSIGYVTSMTLLHKFSKLNFYKANYKLKSISSTIYYFSLTGAVTFFVLMELYPCQDYVKTCFSLFEYLIVGSILIIHLLQALDYNGFVFMCQEDEEGRFVEIQRGNFEKMGLVLERKVSDPEISRK